MLQKLCESDVFIHQCLNYFAIKASENGVVFCAIDTNGLNNRFLLQIAKVNTSIERMHYYSVVDR